MPEPKDKQSKMIQSDTIIDLGIDREEVYENDDYTDEDIHCLGIDHLEINDIEENE